VFRIVALTCNKDGFQVEQCKQQITQKENLQQNPPNETQKRTYNKFPPNETQANTIKKHFNMCVYVQFRNATAEI